MAKQFTPQMAVEQFEEMFPSDEACKSYLTAGRWPEGVRCPRCGNTKLSHLKARSFHWQCRNRSGTGYRFSVTVGTIFENSNVGLRKWFQVIYMILVGKRGASAHKVQRVMRFGSYETAHYLCHRIRAALVDPEFRKLMAIAEIDDTYVGDENKNRNAEKRLIGSGIANKFSVIGTVTRKGTRVARALKYIDQSATEFFVTEAVPDKVDPVATDESALYLGLRRKVSSTGLCATLLGSMSGAWSKLRPLTASGRF